MQDNPENLTPYLSNLEGKVREFNNFVQRKGIGFRLRLTGESEGYTYQVQLVLSLMETMTFLIQPHFVRGTWNEPCLAYTYEERFEERFEGAKVFG